MTAEQLRVEVARWLEILFGIAGVGLIIYIAIKREAGMVICAAPPPFPWVTFAAGVVLVMPWTMGRAFARSFITGVISRVSLPGNRSGEPSS